MIGADDGAHVLKGWRRVVNAEEYRRGVDDVFEEHLTPVPHTTDSSLQSADWTPEKT